MKNKNPHINKANVADTILKNICYFAETARKERWNITKLPRKKNAKQSIISKLFYGLFWSSRADVFFDLLQNVWEKNLKSGRNSIKKHKLRCHGCSSSSLKVVTTEYKIQIYCHHCGNAYYMVPESIK